MAASDTGSTAGPSSMIGVIGMNLSFFVLAGLGLAALASAPAGAIVGGSPDAAGGRNAIPLLSMGGSFCTALVIAPDVLLTAAHCVGVGAAKLRAFRPGTTPPALETVSAVAVHP